MFYVYILGFVKKVKQRCHCPLYSYGYGHIDDQGHIIVLKCNEIDVGKTHHSFPLMFDDAFH